MKTKKGGAKRALLSFDLEGDLRESFDRAHVRESREMPGITRAALARKLLARALQATGDWSESK